MLFIDVKLGAVKLNTTSLLCLFDSSLYLIVACSRGNSFLLYITVHDVTLSGDINYNFITIVIALVSLISQ